MHNAAWEAVDAETAEGPAAADAAVGSGASGFPAQAGTIPGAAAGALAVQEQLKWDGTRPNIHRSYVQHLAAQRSLQGELMAAEKAALVQQLAAQPRHCSRCGSAAACPGAVCVHKLPLQPGGASAQLLPAWLWRHLGAEPICGWLLPGHTQSQLGCAAMQPWSASTLV